jgi:hypothetical protein
MVEYLSLIMVWIWSQTILDTVDWMQPHEKMGLDESYIENTNE